MKKSFNDFMEETALINRWQVLKIALAGAFVGSILTVAVVLAGLVKL